LIDGRYRSVDHVKSLIRLCHVDNLNLDGGCFTLLQSKHIECPRFGIVLQAFRLEEPLFRAGVVPSLVLPVGDSQGWIHTASVVELLQYKIDVSITNCWAEVVHLGREILPEVVNRPRA
jgi:hypothetical protein